MMREYLKRCSGGKVMFNSQLIIMLLASIMVCNGILGASNILKLKSKNATRYYIVSTALILVLIVIHTRGQPEGFVQYNFLQLIIGLISAIVMGVNIYYAFKTIKMDLEKYKDELERYKDELASKK